MLIIQLSAGQFAIGEQWAASREPLHSKSTPLTFNSMTSTAVVIQHVRRCAQPYILAQPIIDLIVFRANPQENVAG